MLAPLSVNNKWISRTTHYSTSCRGKGSNPDGVMSQCVYIYISILSYSTCSLESCCLLFSFRVFIPWAACSVSHLLIRLIGSTEKANNVRQPKSIVCKKKGKKNPRVTFNPLSLSQRYFFSFSEAVAFVCSTTTPFQYESHYTASPPITI